MRVIRINSSIEVVYFWTIANSLSDTLSAGFRWLTLVIAGYLMIPRLQKISANDGENNCKCTNDYIYTSGNHCKTRELHGNRRKSLENIFRSALEIIACAHDFCCKKIYLHLPGTIIARQKRFFRCTLANLFRSKKCIIFNVYYRPWSKKSKFEMTLIRHSSF